MNNFLKHNDWARDPAFNHFWRHYDFSNQWIKQHTDASRQGNWLASVLKMLYIFSSNANGPER